MAYRNSHDHVYWRVTRGSCLLVSILVALGLAHGSPQPVTNEVAPRIQTVTFESDVLKTAKTFAVVLPAGYDPKDAPWPVLFLFHGRGRTERSLIDDPGAREALLSAPFVTVLPDGDDGWYINSPARLTDRYQDYTDEVIAVSESVYNLSSHASQRGLSGWSMGGFGCTRYAIENPEKFGALAPMIGLLDFPRSGLPKGQSYAVPVERFGDDPGVWMALNPLHGAEALRDMALCIITASEAFDRTMNENFAARLEELDMEHDWHRLNGGHTFDVVRKSLPVVIEFMTRNIASAER